MAAVVEAARVLAAGHPSRATAKVVAFGAEEQALDGSSAFIAAHREEIAGSAIGMVSLELVGAGCVGKQAAKLVALLATS